MADRCKSEEGVAMVTSVLVSVVVLILGLVAVQLSFHNIEAGSVDRKRVQAVEAAEAGIDESLRHIQGNGPSTLACTLAGTLGNASYQSTITYYATYPPTGSPMACPLSVTPSAAVVTSRGTTVAPVRGARTMQTQVRLTPVRGSFNMAIFSNSSISLVNNLELLGSRGNDGDVYTNGDFDCLNASVISGSVRAQGHVKLANTCEVRQDVWAGGPHTGAAGSPPAVGGGYVSNGSSRPIGHDAMSSSSFVELTKVQSRVNGRARAGTTVTCFASCSTQVAEGIVPQSPQPAPPRLSLPEIPYDEPAWISRGYTIVNRTDCASAKSYIDNNLRTATTPTVVRITGCSRLTWANRSSVQVARDTAIVIDGGLDFGQQTTFQTTPAGSKAKLFLIVPYSSGTDPNVPAYTVNSSRCGTATSPDITAQNLTAFEGLTVLVYSPCKVSWQNHNSGGAPGQVVGGQVEIANSFTLTFSELLVPGAGPVTGYNIDVVFKREIVGS
ncbi:MAG TPA: hypothetical protein VHE80_00070 [Acidimicrobiales bacterium]|nr:hypothetical protein [Acidimicrobiales bacterium]